MNKLPLFIAILFISLVSSAQTPNKISYQAVIRNNSGQLIINQSIGMQISILQGSTTGASVYTETQTPTTNANGLVSIEIGAGITIDDFSSIDWVNGSYFIKIETDITGGTNYSLSGTSQLLSVPYALHAKTAETVTGDISEIDPVFGTSVAKGITISDTTRWNNKLDKYLEIQNLEDVLSQNNSAGNNIITNLAEPINDQDAATKLYVDELKLQIEELQVATGLRVKDIDGNTYKVIKIGNQIWMAENLKVLNYADGSPIPNVAEDMAWEELTTSDPAYCWYYYADNNFHYGDIYGAMYTWAAATHNEGTSAINPSGIQGVCPTGWHLPSEVEWTELFDYLGDTTIAGGKLKEIGTTHWVSPNTGATNESGFTALPGGKRTYIGMYYGHTYYSSWWSSTELSGDGAYQVSVGYDRSIITCGEEFKKSGLYVRCVKDH